MARALAILLVEDNDDDALLFRKSLKKLHMTVTRAPDTATAIHQLSKANTLPDLIVLDVNLGDSPPENLLDWTETHPLAKHIPVCIYTDSSIIAARLKNRVRAAFLKKNTPEEIRSTVDQMRAFCA